MEFEYDLNKSKINKEKHGISLEEAKTLWLGIGVEIETGHLTELRFLRIGQIGDRFYSCAFTIRGNKIRLISARRSRPEEKEIYKKELKRNEEEQGEKDEG